MLLTTATQTSTAGSFRRTHSIVASGVAAVAVVFSMSSPGFAQETREGRLAAERAAKAQTLRPYEPSPLERRLERVDGLMSTERPVYAFMGSVFEGGGFALGPGYRARLGDSGTFNAHAAWSIRNFKEADAELRKPLGGNGRVRVALRTNWLDAPGVAFYGVGSDSRKEDRTGFLYRSMTVGGSAMFQATKRISVGTSIDAIGFETEPVGNYFAQDPISPNYRKTSVFAAYDSRTAPQYSRRGGLYRVEWSDYRQTNTGSHSFSRMDAEVQQFVPLLRENWVLAFRALASTTDADSGSDVPYFMMPELGGSHMLRGYSSWRFRDRNRMLMTAEYRWTAGPFVDMALFFDAGKVAARRADLNFDKLNTSHGIGMSFHTANSTIMRVEFARSREGQSLLLSFSPSF